MESLFNQTHQADEIVIVCEGELSEELKKVLFFWKEKFGSNVVKIVYATTEKGFAACLNLGLQNSTKKWVARFDTDDICEPSRFEKQIAFLRNNPEIVLSSTFLQEYDETFTQKLGVRTLPILQHEIVKYAKWKSPFNHPSAIYNREIALSLGSYPLLNANEDYAFFSKFLVNGYKAGNMQEPLVKARAGDGLIARRRGWKYLRGEIECMKFLYQIGLFGRFHLFAQITMKSIIRLMPFFLVKFIYKQVRS